MNLHTKKPSASTTRSLRDALIAAMAFKMERSELGALQVPRAEILNYKLIPTDVLVKPDDKREAFKINSLIDLYYFSTITLGKYRLQTGPNFQLKLHYQMCLTVMKDGLKEVIEIPRDHFKSTIYSECFPIWRALPFNEREEDLFTALGYSDLFIEWMRRAHSQDIRILIISETIKNAIKIGTRISNTYQNNGFFRELFPEILPGSSQTWTNDSLHQKRTSKGMGQGEGTFDLLGVGAALQSRHYDLAIQDDLVGKDALNSEPVMKSTIEYHQLLPGAMDSAPFDPNRDFDEIIVGNRWSHKDLNSHVRENESYFNFTTHSALGGCCKLHPFGIPIFPEEFSIEKLLRWKKRFGTYFFTCQFLNSPIDPSKAKFKLGDFRYFHFENVEGALANPKGGYSVRDTINKVELGKPTQKRTIIRHHVAAGDVEKDVFPRHLDRYMVVDPNHSGQHSKLGGGRCRHAIIVSGVLRDPRRVYILDAWAEAVSIDLFVAKMFEIAIKWKLNKIHVEAVGAQKYLLYHLEYYISQNKRDNPILGTIKIEPLKTPQTAGAKEERIDGTIPSVERNEVWLDARNCAKFIEEAEAYGQKKGLIDLLDVFGYGPQVWKFDTTSEEEIESFLSARLNRFTRNAHSVAGT
jgi:hypothetical protein